MLGMDDDPARQLARAQNWARTNFPAAPRSLPKAGAAPGKLRIGYFSADFHDHPVMHLMARLFELHDRDRFEVHLFSFGPDRQDAMRQRAVQAADRFHDVRAMSDGAILALTREAGIDIAIDLMGYTRGARTELFARRLAPLQVNYLGYPGTMGAAFMDHIIADPWVVPEADSRFYAEKVLRLPHAFMATDNGRAAAEDRFTRSHFGLPQDGLVFCCFNNSYKITPAEFGIWMRLLQKVPGSVAWLAKDSEEAAANLIKEAAARGVDKSRLIFAERVPDLGDYLARYRCADIFLDTFHYNAHATASDVLWAGLPLITKSGRSFPSRVAGSLLKAAGLPELVTDTAEAYEALALELATRPERLAAIKAKLAANRLTTPLFDSEGFTRDFERALESIRAS
jgi:predicted O-linked N-acetylglucosamine transferase (SPINDLY family)